MKRNILITVLVLLVPFLGGGLIGYGIGHTASGNGIAAAETPGGERPYAGAQNVRDDAASRDSLGGSVTGGRRNAITRAVSIASPAVVGINVMELRQYRQWSPWGNDPFFRQFFGDRTVTQQVPSLGSGFIISPDGYILTNDHVAGNAKEITVTVTGGQQFKAELVGTDLVSDIALLKVDAKNLPYMRLGNSDDVLVGEWVIAMGNPFGLFDINDKPTVTVGVVSNTGVKLQSQDGRVYKGMIQTDAAINAGNSGGPLLNALGEVIGVNAVIYTPNQGNIGLGFAIPINRVKSIVAELRKHGKIERSFWTGLEIQSVDRRIAQYFGLDKVQGVIVSEVQKNSPAERSGFRVGDIILAANGERLDDESSLLAAVDDARAGDVLTLKVFREHKTLELKLPLEKRTQ
jgi:serine protease Do